MGTLHTGGHRPCLAAGGFTETICGTAGAKNIGVVFRENERGRIYGVTFIDHDRREVFNGSRMGKEFSANVFNDYFNGWKHTRKGTGWTFRYRASAASPSRIL